MTAAGRIRADRKGPGRRGHGVGLRLEAVSDDADDEGFAGGLDDFLGDGVALVDVQDALDLGDEAAGEAEVPAGDAVDGRDGFGGGVVVGIV